MIGMVMVMIGMGVVGWKVWMDIDQDGDVMMLS
jgi:hypothetical protein